jgi:hypothetical protein
MIIQYESSEPHQKRLQASAAKATCRQMQAVTGTSIMQAAPKQGARIGCQGNLPQNAV